MPPREPASRQTRVLITGAGGPAAIAVMRSLRADPSVLIAADMDSWAAGLYLVRPERMLIPAGREPGFARSCLIAAGN